MTVLREELASAQLDAVIRSGLHEYLDGLQTKMNEIGETLNQDFFVLRPDKRPDHGPGQSQSQGQWQKSERAPA